MKINKIFSGKFLAAADLDGEPLDVVFAKILLEEVAADQDEMPVCHFSDETIKPFVLNKTNATMIAGMHGQDTDFWIGKAVRLYPTETEFGGKMVDCIRVEKKAPASEPTSEPIKVTTVEEAEAALKKAQEDLPF